MGKSHRCHDNANKQPPITMVRRDRSCVQEELFSYRFSTHIMMSLARGKVSEAAARLAIAEGMIKVSGEVKWQPDHIKAFKPHPPIPTSGAYY